MCACVLNKGVSLCKRVSDVQYTFDTGNPVRSLDVAEWATCYTRWLAHLGYNPQSAHPWSLSDLQQVLERLDARITTTIGIPQLRLHRDAFTMTILWETCSRGATAVSWCLDDLWLASGMLPQPPPCQPHSMCLPALPLPWPSAKASCTFYASAWLALPLSLCVLLPDLPLPADGFPPLAGVPAAQCLHPTLDIPLGEAVLFKALEIKHNLHPDVMVITRKDGPLCPIQRLHTLLVQSAALGHPITQFLCRPLSASKDRFLERSLSVAAFEEDIDAHFTAANIPYHATLHGSRRGSLQHHDQQGQSLEAIGLLAQIKTPSVTKRYIDPTRHLPSKLAKGKRPNKRVRLT
jgi:hypothetical protein